MKFSDAIRLGAMLKPQCDVLMSDRGTCAIGAALDAVSALPWANWWTEERVFDRLYEFANECWPILCEVVKSPINNDRRMLKNIVISLNDRANWTREQIADWIETLEQEGTDESHSPKPLAETTDAVVVGATHADGVRRTF